MDDIDVQCLNALHICTAIAVFLLNTGRVQRAIDLFKESLFFLKNKTLQKNEILIKEVYPGIYHKMFNGYIIVNDYARAIECGTKLLVMNRALGKRAKESKITFDMAKLHEDYCDYDKAVKFYMKALHITKEIGERQGEAACYGNLGNLLHIIGAYAKADEYFQKALAINEEIGCKEGEASCYHKLGVLFCSLGEYVKAKGYHERALAISKTIGDRNEEAVAYANLGVVFGFLGEYVQTISYLEKALAITKKMGCRKVESFCYANLGVCEFDLQFDCIKAEKYLQKALTITKEIGDRKSEAITYGNLGNVFLYLGDYVKAKDHHNKALTISKEIGDIRGEVFSLMNRTLDMLTEGNVDEAILSLFGSICKCENIQHFLGDNDQFKISFLDNYFLAYQMLSVLLCTTGNPNEALYVVELGRARALADLMAHQYFVADQISVDPESWVGIELIMEKEKNCVCLYIFYHGQDIFLWIVRANNPILLRRINVNELCTEGSVQNLGDFLRKEPIRKLHIVPQDHCEDRSLPLNARHVTPQSQEDSFAALRLIEEDEHNQDQEPKLTLALYYKMIIAPVADLLDEPEILIVPDRALFKVPFAALKDESGKYLSETFRIRIAPSLTTLKLILETPTDNCLETPALIVGDPDVSNVIELSQLPFARKEADMIGGLLGVQPLLGHQATKLAVLEMMHSASLIHFAAHGNAERGEIALAPVRPVNRILHRDDYVLTMSDIALVQLRAKLVVLSCCHSGLGQIKAEGVIGIARAFLGSGARSVLASLWAIEDKATEQFMSRFYEHLVRGKNASESLHEAMKWMRGNGFSDVRHWAPFMLVGDNVAFDFGK